MKTLDRHFALTEQAAEVFKQRTDPVFRSKVERVCRSLIKMAPEAATAFLAQYPNSLLPGHQGYESLSQILAEDGKFKAAIDLCKQAEDEGWSGEWDAQANRFEQCRLAWEFARTTVSQKPGTLQTEIYLSLPDVPKDCVSYVLYYAAKRGAIIRERNGRTYRLMMSGPRYECPQCQRQVVPGTDGKVTCECGAQLEVE